MTTQQPPAFTDHCIAVVGMNASGKSNFGRTLASKLQMKRIDIDKEFEKLHGDIQQFIDRSGWPAFREAEERIALASFTPGTVLILGGGAIESAETRKALKESACVIWIQAGRKRIHKNLTAARVQRPEFKDGHTHAGVKNLLDSRMPLYEEVADIVLLPHLRFSEQVPTAITLLRRKLGATNKEGV